MALKKYKCRFEEEELSESNKTWEMEYFIPSSNFDMYGEDIKSLIIDVETFLKGLKLWERKQKITTLGYLKKSKDDFEYINADEWVNRK